MNGGIIDQLTRSSKSIVLKVQGIGPLENKFMMVRILPTNYQLQKGDLVWWHDDQFHWEGRVSCEFRRIEIDNPIPMESVESESHDTTLWEP